MLRLSLAVIAIVASLASAAPSGTSSAAVSTPTTIRTDQDPVYHFYLQNIDGKPVLGPEASAGEFLISNTIQLSNSTSPLFFNVNTTATTSYKPVFFSSTAVTTAWDMSGDTIIDGNTQNFLVCPISGSSNFDLFLQTGNDVPDATCTDWITIHLPCLC